MIVPQAIRRIYAPEYMVKASLLRGEVPPTGEAYRTTFSTAWASIAESFLIALISMADTVMVGTVGPHAIAAVGLVTQPRFIVLTLIMSLNMAVTAITARRKGENDPDGASRCLKQALLISTGLSIVLSLLAYVFRTPLLLFCGAAPDTLVEARTYFEIILLGIPISAVTMTISAGQRGIGETRVSMVINMVANSVNLVFNYLLINGVGVFPKLGVQGAAIATDIGFVFGFLLAVLSVAHKGSFLYLFSKEIPWKPDRQTVSALFRVSSGSFVEQICLRMGFLTYAKIVAGLGTMMFAAHQICMNILNLSFSFGEGFGIAASSLVGQGLGAKRPDLSIVYGKICQRMSFISCSVMLCLFVFAGKYMVLIFTGEQEIIDVCVPILYISSMILYGQASQMIFMGSLRGAGDTRYTAVISLISILFIRTTISYALTYPLGLGLIGAWLALIFDQYLRLFLTWRRFSSGKWMAIKL